MPMENGTKPPKRSSKRTKNGDHSSSCSKQVDRSILPPKRTKPVPSKNTESTFLGDGQETVLDADHQKINVPRFKKTEDRSLINSSETFEPNSIFCQASTSKGPQFPSHMTNGTKKTQKVLNKSSTKPNEMKNDANSIAERIRKRKALAKTTLVNGHGASKFYKGINKAISTSIVSKARQSNPAPQPPLRPIRMHIRPCRTATHEQTSLAHQNYNSIENKHTTKPVTRSSELKAVPDPRNSNGPISNSGHQASTQSLLNGICINSENTSKGSDGKPKKLHPLVKQATARPSRSLNLPIKTSVKLSMNRDRKPPSINNVKYGTRSSAKVFLGASTNSSQPLQSLPVAASSSTQASKDVNHDIANEIEPISPISSQIGDWRSNMNISPMHTRLRQVKEGANRKPHMSVNCKTRAVSKNKRLATKVTKVKKSTNSSRLVSANRLQSRNQTLTEIPRKTQTMPENDTLENEKSNTNSLSQPSSLSLPSTMSPMKSRAQLTSSTTAAQNGSEIISTALWGALMSVAENARYSVLQETEASKSLTTVHKSKQSNEDGSSVETNYLPSTSSSNDAQKSGGPTDMMQCSNGADAVVQGPSGICTRSRSKKAQEEAVRKANSSLDEKSCCVCLDGESEILEEKRHFVSMKCNHSVCNTCWDKLTKRRFRRCPVCRLPLFDDATWLSQSDNGFRDSYSGESFAEEDDDSFTLFGWGRFDDAYDEESFIDEEGSGSSFDFPFSDDLEDEEDEDSDEEEENANISGSELGDSTMDAFVDRLFFQGSLMGGATNKENDSRNCEDDVEVEEEEEDDWIDWDDDEDVEDDWVDEDFEDEDDDETDRPINNFSFETSSFYSQSKKE